MKVVCIDDDWRWDHDNSKADGLNPVKDGIYEVLEAIHIDSKDWYKLKGFNDCIYDAISFAPLDDYLEQFTESLTKELTEVKQLELI